MTFVKLSVTVFHIYIFLVIMSKENQPAIPTERVEPKGLIEQFYKQPEVGGNQSKRVIQNKSDATPTSLYECNLCAKKYHRLQDLNNHTNVHNYFNFLCWVCKRNLRMSHLNMIEHFRTHENQILHRTQYTKEVENPIFSLYTKTFDDWPVTVFENQFLDDITDIVRVNAFLKKRLIVRMNCKLWFIPKPSSEDKIGKYIWSALPSIQFEWSSLNIKRKISDFGKSFMSSFLDQDSIEDSGSGYVYYAISEVSIKCIKNATIGCFIPWEHKHKILLEHLTQKKIVFNPLCSSFCLRECLEKFSTLSGININLAFELFNKPMVSLFDFEEWDQNDLNFGLRIVILNEENSESLYPIFVSDSFHEKETQVNLLAVLNSNTDDNAHFILILNFDRMLWHIKNLTRVDKPKMKRFFTCKFCLQKTSESFKVIIQHENFCLNNPNTSFHEHNPESVSMITFEAEKNFLKCSINARTPPNWIGFLDFETIAVNTDTLTQNVCKKHKLMNQDTCKCPITNKSKSIEALSYSFILVDFNSEEVVSEIFYIQKNQFDLSAPAHFVSTLKKIALTCQIINEIEQPIKMSEKQKIFHRNATHCRRCGRKFTTKRISRDIFKNMDKEYLGKVKCVDNSLVIKTAHHIHHLKENNFSASICSKCNLAIQSRHQKIPILCHNFGRFDHILILKELCKEWPKQLKFIPKSFNNFMSINADPFVLKDSLNFLSGSLDENVEIVRKSCLKTCEKCKLKASCKRCELRSKESFKQVFSSIYASDISKVKEKTNDERFFNNLRKSAFPYSVLTSYEDLKNMILFPKHEIFFSILKNENVGETEYLLAKNYFQKYCQNMYDFLKVYNILDTHLLYSVWKIMSKTLSDQFGFYLEQFISLPGYSFEVAKSFTPHPSLPELTNIEMFTERNKDMYFKSLQNIRGGIVQVNSRFELDSRLQNFLSIENSSDNEELLYIDATNLYGYCLSNRLPCSDYMPVSSPFISALNNLLEISDIEKKCKILHEILPDDSSRGFAFDIKINHIPKKLHEFPPFFAKQSVKATDISNHDQKSFTKIDGNIYSGKRQTKLLPLLHKGATTFCHYKLLKEAVQQGVLIEVLSGISFTHKFLFKDYIEILAKLRANTNNPAHARSFKLLSNALFGKLLQSILKYNRDFRFFYVKDWEQFNFTQINNIIQNRQYNSRKRIFKDIRILDNDFFAVETQQCAIKASNCPLIAFTILELAKTRNFSFFWKMKNLSPRTKLLYCDTDSFIIKCKKTWYKDVTPIKDEFDFSKDSFKFSYMMKLTNEDKEKNSRLIGKYKSEIDSDTILMGVIALQKKCYCLLLIKQFKCPLCQKYSALCECVVNYQGKQLYYIIDNVTAKGKDVKQLSFVRYLEALLHNQWTCEQRYRISQERKELHFAFKKYRSIINFDDSNFTLNCGIHNAPFFSSNHISSQCNEESCKNYTIIANKLEEQFEMLTKTLFYFENGNMNAWSPSPPSPYPPLSPLNLSFGTPFLTN